MNISREPGKQISLMNLDFKLPVLDATKTSDVGTEKFSDLLKKETYGSFGPSLPAPQETVIAKNPQTEEYNKTQDIPSSERKENISEPSKEEIKSVESEEKKSNSDDHEEIEEDEHTLDEDALRHSLNIFAQNFPFKNLNEIKPKNREDGWQHSSSQVAFLKSSAYLGQSKESGSFLEDAKKLAETIFKKEAKSFKKTESGETVPKKESSDKNANNLVEFPESKTFGKEKITVLSHFKETRDIDRKKETGSFTSKTTTSSQTNVSKEQPKLSQETVKAEPVKQEQVVSFGKHLEKNKETSSSKKVSLKEETSKDKQEMISDSNVISEKTIRSMGVKDREFNRSESRQPQVSDKPKLQEVVSVPVNTHSSSSGNSEEGSFNQGDKKGSFKQEGFSLGGELKSSSKFEEVLRSEKSNAAPSKAALQKNMEELVKQARFDIVQNGKSTAEIVMNPKDFGRLTLKVSVTGEKVEGRILVESEEMKSLLTGEISGLKEKLKESGLELETLLVDIWDDSGSSLSENRQDKGWNYDPEYADAYFENTNKQKLSGLSEVNEVDTRIDKGFEIFA